jgi:hypothetical protein
VLTNAEEREYAESLIRQVISPRQHLPLSFSINRSSTPLPLLAGSLHCIAVLSCWRKHRMKLPACYRMKSPTLPSCICTGPSRRARP